MVPIAFESPSDLATAGQNSPRSTRIFILTSKPASPKLHEALCATLQC